ncbi:glutamyl-tRNA reductase [Georgenia sp.]
MLVLLSANHHDLDLAEVERLSTGAHEVGRQVVVQQPAVRGAVVLATCNRFEVYLDAGPDADAETTAAAVRAAHRAVARASGAHEREVAELMRAATGPAAVQHLFEVASGLDAIVVGEREITGQVRRALETARAEGTTSPLLEHTLQQATRTSRQVAVATDLARAGRSVVSVALDLAGSRLAEHGCERDQPAAPRTRDEIVLPRADWSERHVLLVGTGSYAGASLAALRERGVGDVEVWSASGRSRAFAESHGIRAATDLTDALAGADLVVTCRGTGSTVLGTATVADALAARRARGRTGPLVVVDLALNHDVDPAVESIDGVLLVNLPTVREHAPAATAQDVTRAREIVADGVRGLAADLAERRMDDAVIALRSTVEAAVSAELDRLPADGVVTTGDATRALHRLAARLLHEPTVRARAAGRDGRASEHLVALEQVLGITVPAVPATAAVAVAAQPAPAREVPAPCEQPLGAYMPIH